MPRSRESRIRRHGYDQAVPIYEFECGDCGERFELLVEAGTGAAECVRCGAEAGRVMSSFGVTTRQLTPRQRRRLEQERGTDRGGARARWQRRVDGARARRRQSR